MFQSFFGPVKSFHVLNFHMVCAFPFRIVPMMWDLSMSDSVFFGVKIILWLHISRTMLSVNDWSASLTVWNLSDVLRPYCSKCSRFSSSVLMLTLASERLDLRLLFSDSSFSMTTYWTLAFDNHSVLTSCRWPSSWPLTGVIATVDVDLIAKVMQSNTGWVYTAVWTICVMHANTGWVHTAFWTICAMQVNTGWVHTAVWTICVESMWCSLTHVGCTLLSELSVWCRLTQVGCILLSELSVWCRLTQVGCILLSELSVWNPCDAV